VTVRVPSLNDFLSEVSIEYNVEMFYDLEVFGYFPSTHVTFPQVRCDTVKCQKGPTQAKISPNIFLFGME